MRLLSARGVGPGALALKAVLELAVRRADQMAQGDLTQPIEVRGRDEAAQLLTALQGMQASLARVSITMLASGES